MGVTYINPYRFGVAFSPLDLSPAFWLDADDATTITASSGSVSQWNDKSGNGRNVTQATASAQPTTGASTLNGRNVITFDGINDFMDSGSVTLTGQQWHLMVIVSNSSSRLSPLSNTGATTEATVFTSGASSPLYRWAAYRAGTGTTVMQSTTTSAAASTPYIVVCNFNSGSSSMRINGANVVTGTVGNNNTNNFRLGRNPATAYAAGTFAEIVVVSGSLTAQQVSDFEAYASAKWGIAI